MDFIAQRTGNLDPGESECFETGNPRQWNKWSPHDLTRPDIREMFLQRLVQFEIDRPEWPARRYFRKKLHELRDEHVMINVRQLIAAYNYSTAI